MGACQPKASTAGKSYYLVDNAENVNVITSRIIVASTGALEVLLQQPNLRQRFRDFIINYWVPAIKSESSIYFKSNARSIALNCLDFWVDSRDFSKLGKSSFQIYRACYIFEKYVMYGAGQHVPVSYNVLDECKERLFGETTDVEFDFFCSAQSEALDFLISEVFDSFELYSATPGNLLGRKENKNMLLMVNGRHIKQRHGTGASEPPNEAIITALSELQREILSDREYTAAFRSFLLRAGAPYILSAYLDAVQLRELLGALIASVKEEDQRQLVLLHCVNIYYDDYLSMNARSKVQLTEATTGDVMARIPNKGETTNSEVLRPVESELFSSLLRQHLDHFLHSPACLQLLRCSTNATSTSTSSATSVISNSNLKKKKHIAAMWYAISRREKTGTGTVDEEPLKLGGCCSGKQKQQRRLDAGNPSTAGIGRLVPSPPLGTALHGAVDISQANRRHHHTHHHHTNNHGHGHSTTRSVGGSSLREVDSEEETNNDDSQTTSVSEVSLSERGEAEDEGVVGECGDENDRRGFTCEDGDSALLTAAIPSAGCSGSGRVKEKGIAVQQLQPQPQPQCQAMNETDEADFKQTIVAPVILEELKGFLRSGFDDIFGRFLAGFKALPLMHFYQSASRYGDAHFNHDCERAFESNMIFHRYLDRNAEEFVDLPPDMRSSVVKGLFLAESTLYADAAEWAANSLALTYWPQFKQEVQQSSSGDISSPHCHAESYHDHAYTSRNNCDDHHELEGGGGNSSTRFSQDDMALLCGQNSVTTTGSSALRLLLGLEKSAIGGHLHTECSLASHYVDKAEERGGEEEEEEEGQPRGDGGMGLRLELRQDEGGGGGVSRLKADAQKPQQYPSFQGATAVFRDNTAAISHFAARAAVKFPVNGVVVNRLRGAGGDCSISLSVSVSGAGSKTSQKSTNLSGAGRKGNPRTSAKTRLLSSFVGFLPAVLGSTKTKPLSSPAGYCGGLDAQSEHDNGNDIALSQERGNLLSGEQLTSSTEDNNAMVTSASLAVSDVTSASAARGRLNSLVGLAASSLGMTFHRLGDRRGAQTVQTIRDILDHPHCCSLFKNFLDREGFSQTLLFFMEIEEFRCIPSADFQRVRARKIFTKYLHKVAFAPVPVSPHTKDVIAAGIGGNMVNPMMFNFASEEVFTYMETFQFPRFQSSPEMVRVLELLSSEICEPGFAVGNMFRRKMSGANSIDINGNTNNGVSSNLTGIIMPQRGRRGSRVSISMHHHVSAADLSSLAQILRYPIPTRIFKEFAARTFCSENVLFWLDVENYIQLPGSDYMKRVACKVYKKYISDGTRTQVNISYAAKEAIFLNLENPSRNIFHKAQVEVYQLMERDTLPKFVQSIEYADLLKLSRNDNNECGSPQGTQGQGAQGRQGGRTVKPNGSEGAPICSAVNQKAPNAHMTTFVRNNKVSSL